MAKQYAEHIIHYLEIETDLATLWIDSNDAAEAFRSTSNTIDVTITTILNTGVAVIPSVQGFVFFGFHVQNA